jgi:glycosyltransferase involved in cell wall biosynthesis
VSVIVPTCDGEAYVRQAIESILAQTYAPFEVLVCDDGSTDGTVAVLESFGERIRLLRQENQGVSSARNHAAREARGSLLAFLDQDDLWEPDLLATQVALLESDPECGFVFADSWVVDASGKLRGRRGEHLRYRAGHVFDALLDGNFVPIETLVTRTDVFREVGGFSTRWRVLEDYALCLRIARTRPVHFTSRPLARYRVHDRNLTRDMEAILVEYSRILAELDEEFPDLSDGERAHAARALAGRWRELAWYALLRGDVDTAEERLRRAGGPGSGALGSKLRLLLGLERVLPGWATRRLVALFPRRKLYGV